MLFNYYCVGEMINHVRNIDIWIWYRKEEWYKCERNRKQGGVDLWVGGRKGRCNNYKWGLLQRL